MATLRQVNALARHFYRASRVEPTLALRKYVRTFMFCSRHEYVEYLEKYHSRLPEGFAVGTTKFDFVPEEAPHLPSTMTMSLIKPTQPTSLFGAVFTQNAFPGAPIIVGRKCMEEGTLGAILINNKISNVCASGGGISDALKVCFSLKEHLGLSKNETVLPCSTGVIGWRLPVQSMIANIPHLCNKLQSTSIFPVAEGIMTTDLYPKIRSANVCGGRIVGIAKGAGMVEPDMATMLSYILTDLSLPRDVLRHLLKDAVDVSFNSMSIDTDQSTSDTVAIISSDQIPFDLKANLNEFKEALKNVCIQLSEDVVRNGEGVHHTMRVHVRGATSIEMAKGVGKSVVNSPLLKCAVAGNDPNVGRLIMAIGKYVGKYYPAIDISRTTSITMGGVKIFDKGEFLLNHDVEDLLIQHLRKAQLIEKTRGGLDVTSHDFPPHNNSVEIDINLGIGREEASVLGCDLTHEYVAINADYRS